MFGKTYSGQLADHFSEHNRTRDHSRNKTQIYYLIVIKISSNPTASNNDYLSPDEDDRSNNYSYAHYIFIFLLIVFRLRFVMSLSAAHRQEESSCLKKGG